jgi:hypothetical protein
LILGEDQFQEHHLSHVCPKMPCEDN